ncbi:MAG: class I SAM-dependent methyltransferase [Candidatus Nealsonbacteria bacterium]|nr:class I SAM-dependent methyltransferase [Candidatus Nealsonbacteria bacterium]
MPDKNCKICGSFDLKVFPNKYFKNTLLRCQKCGLIFVYPQPEFCMIKNIYAQNYFKNSSSHSIGYENYLKDKPNIMKTFERRLKNIEALYPKKGEILDLGCAMGFFLEVAKNHGWNPHGVEISEYASNIAKKRFGNNIFNGVLNQACFLEDSFDIITMWDYLEHIPDPSFELSLIWKLLKKGGMVILSTPNANSLPHKIFRDRWMGYKDQEHLYYFSEKNMRTLLQKNGFKILKSERTGKHISLSLFIKRLNLYSKPLADISRFLTPEKISDFSFYINPLDIICFYAEK